MAGCHARARRYRFSFEILPKGKYHILTYIHIDDLKANDVEVFRHLLEVRDEAKTMQAFYMLKMLFTRRCQVEVRYVAGLLPFVRDFTV